jgi:hypothetical protein
VQQGNSCADNHRGSSSVSVKSTQTPPPGDRTLTRLPIVAYWLRHDVDTHGDEFSPGADNGSLKAQGRLNDASEGRPELKSSALLHPRWVAAG